MKPSTITLPLAGAAALLRIVPRVLDVGLRAHDALTLPDELITGLTTHGIPSSPMASRYSAIESANRYGDVLQSQRLGGEPANAFAIHRQRAARAAGITEALAFQLQQRRRRDRFDFRHDDCGRSRSMTAASAVPSSMLITCERCATCIAGAFG